MAVVAALLPTANAFSEVQDAMVASDMAVDASFLTSAFVFVQPLGAGRQWHDLTHGINRCDSQGFLATATTRWP